MMNTAEMMEVIEYNEGYNTANVIVNGIGLDEARKTQGKLHEMGKSDTFITGYTQALIDTVLTTM